jgi:hypothetical protein
MLAFAVICGYKEGTCMVLVWKTFRTSQLPVITHDFEKTIFFSRFSFGD